MKQVKKLKIIATFFGIILMILSVGFEAGAQTVKKPEEILEQLQYSQVHIDHPLSARLRLQNGTLIPFTLVWNGPNITFQFKDPDETLRLKLNENGAVLTQQTQQGGTQRITDEKSRQQIRGSDITYEDIAMKFLYWKKAKLEQESNLRGMTCWTILLQPESLEASNYATVRLWIPQNEGFFLRAEGFDRKGKLLKRFEVVSGQKIGDKWFLKQLRVESFNPETRKQVSKTYLEIDK